MSADLSRLRELLEVTSHVLLPCRTRSEILSTVHQLAADFHRLPMEFERGYLGRGPPERVAMLEALDAEQLSAQEHSVAEHLRLTRQGLQEQFGYRLASRSALLLRLAGGAEAPPGASPSAQEAVPRSERSARSSVDFGRCPLVFHCFLVVFL